MPNLSNGRPPHLFIEGSPKLAVTLKSCENRVFADSPPHRAQTVYHFKSNGYILNKCFSKSTVTARVDGPPHKWRTVRNSFGHPIQKDQVSEFQVLKADRLSPGAGRSAVHFGPPSRAKISSVQVQTRQLQTVRPQERTVRRSISSRNVPW